MIHAHILLIRGTFPLSSTNFVTVIPPQFSNAGAGWLRNYHTTIWVKRKAGRPAIPAPRGSPTPPYCPRGELSCGNGCVRKQNRVERILSGVVWLLDRQLCLTLWMLTVSEGGLTKASECCWTSRGAGVPCLASASCQSDRRPVWISPIGLQSSCAYCCSTTTREQHYNKTMQCQRGLFCESIVCMVAAISEFEWKRTLLLGTTRERAKGFPDPPPALILGSDRIW